MSAGCSARGDRDLTFSAEAERPVSLDAAGRAIALDTPREATDEVITLGGSKALAFDWLGSMEREFERGCGGGAFASSSTPCEVDGAPTAGISRLLTTPLSLMGGLGES